MKRFSKGLLILTILMLVFSSFSLIVVAQALDNDCNLWCRLVYLFTGKMPITGGAVIDETQETGLVALWHMDEGSGSTVYDSVGNNDGTITGATWVDGKFGKALSFDGVDDYVAVPDSASLDGMAELTISVWVKFNSLTGTWNHIIEKYGSPWDVYGISVNTNTGTFRYGITTDVDGATGWLDSGYSVDMDTWYFLTLSYDGSDLKFYIDGNLHNSTSWTGNLITSNEILEIVETANQNYYVNGTIDEVAIYNRALTPEEIAAHAADVPTCGESHSEGLVSYWKADGDASDAYGNNDGSINGATFVEGKVGQAFSFDGVDDYVKINYSDSLNITQKITVEAWIKWDSNTFKDAGILIKHNVGEAGNGDYELRLDDGLEGVAFRIVNEYDALISTDYIKISAGRWYHIAGTYDGTSIKLYVDGVLKSEKTTSGAIRGSSSNVFIGSRWQGGPGATFNGLIDEVAIYDRALTADEINQHYINGLNSKQYCTPAAPEPEPLVANYTFNDCTATDSSTYGNDGTINGAICVDSPIAGGGRALSFDGVDDYVIISDSASLDITDAITIEAWVKPDSNTGQRWIAGKNGRYQLLKSSAGNFFRGQFKGTDDNWYYIDSPTSYSENNWYHVAYTYDGNYLRIYMNGVLGDSKYVGVDMAANNFCSIFIGGANDVASGCKYSGQYFNGLIDEVKIYNRALTPEEIQQHYNETKPEELSLSQWAYKREITIDNTENSNALTDYQIKVEFDGSALISEGKMNSDCSDLRFSDQNGNQLSYWLESCPSVAWVKVPNIPAGSTASIYMYYGNPNAASASNKSATMYDWNDFSTQVNGYNNKILGYAKSSYSTIEIVDGKLHVNIVGDSTGNRDAAYLHLSEPFNATDVGMYFSIDYLGSDGSPNTQYNPRFTTLNGAGNFNVGVRGTSWSSRWREIYVRSGGTLYWWDYNNDVWTTSEKYLTSDLNRKIEAFLANGQAKIVISDLSGNVLEDTSWHAIDNPTDMDIRIGVKWGYDTNGYYFDNLVIRKYASPEPTISIGSEETTAAVVCPEGAVSVWQFDEGSGNIASDVLGVNNGTIYGATWTTGKVGSALSFDGSDDYVRIQATPISNAIADGFTVEYWFKLQNTFDSSASENQLLVGEGGNPGEGGINPMGMLQADTGKLRVYWWKWRSVYSKRTSWTGGEWYHIVVRQVPNGQIYLYVNGVDNSGDREIWEVGDQGTNGNWYFGGSVPYDGKYFNGLIDEVAIYNRALTPEEIADHYNNGLGKHVCTVGAAPPECSDADGDGFGAQGTDLSACTGSTTLSDCDDTNALINPADGCPCTAKADCTTYCWGNAINNYTCHSTPGNSDLPTINVFAPAKENCANCWTGEIAVPSNIANACVPQWTITTKYGDVCDSSQPCINGYYCANDNTFKQPIIS